MKIRSVGIVIYQLYIKIEYICLYQNFNLSLHYYWIIGPSGFTV